MLARTTSIGCERLLSKKYILITRKFGMHKKARNTATQITMRRLSAQYVEQHGCKKWGASIL
jgi:hypothetical protein